MFADLQTFVHTFKCSIVLSVSNDDYDAFSVKINKILINKIFQICCVCESMICLAFTLIYCYQLMCDELVNCY